MPDEFLQLLDKIPFEDVDIQSIILPNGMTLSEFEAELEGGRTTESDDGPQLTKNKIINEMLQRAAFLMDRSRHVKNGEGPNKPAQPNGLAYGFGNKEYSEREKPVGPIEEEVFGLDCSGFLVECVNNVLGKLKDGVGNLKDPGTWNTAINEKFKSKCSKVEMVDQGKLPFDQLMTGDVIYWYDQEVKHIGFIANLPGTTRFLINSNGSAGSSCYKKDKNNKTYLDKDCLKAQAEKNRSTARGPRMISMDDAVFTKGYWGNNYSVLRLTTDVNGKWDLYVRCEGQTSAAITADIQITSDKNGEETIPVSASGTGTDYTGDPISFSITGEYNTITNILKGSISMTFPNNPGDQRVDGFEVKLLKDETPYVAAEIIVPNGGCPVEFKLLKRSCGEENSGGRLEVFERNSSYGLSKPK